MRIGKDIGIHAQREAGTNLEFAGACCQQRKLRLALHVEFQNSGFEREVDLAAVFPTPEKTTRLAASGAAAITRSQLAAGDDVEACAVPASSFRIASAEFALTA